jgi:hypothetical protein
MDWYTAFPRQAEFHRSKKKYRLFGGAAGPGKTKALLAEAMEQAREVAGSNTLLLRRSYPELEASVLTYFRRDVPRDEYLSYNEAKHLVTWKNGSTTKFGYCRNENDIYQYQGAEYLFIGIDELTHFTLKQWQFLTSRNRCPIPKYTSGYSKGKNVVPCMAGATNPGNIGHAWVKALWVDKTAPPGFERPELYNPEDYAFIRARIEDNPIYANDVNYKKALAALPDKLRRAFLDGDWNFFAGQYFDVFEFGRHTARAEDVKIEEWAPRWISIDWGFRHPSAVYWHGVGTRREVASGEWRVASEEELNTATPRGHRGDKASIGDERQIVTYREFVKNELSPGMLAQAIVERTGKEKIREIYLSPDAFAKRTSEASIAEQLGDVLEKYALPRPVAANDDRIGGWQLMYQLLERDGWVITNDCRKLLDCLPTLIHDERRAEDVRKMEGDDPADAARYGIVPGARYAGVGAQMGAPWAGQAPPEIGSAARFVPGIPLGVQIERQITATDPTSQAIHRQRLEGEAKKQLGPHKFGRRWRW